MTAPAIKLESWSTCKESSPFTAPGARRLCLQGLAHGHPRFAAGEKITSTPIVAVSGRLVTTASGSVYELGEPDPNFVKWNLERGAPIDPEQPIRMLRRP